MEDIKDIVEEYSIANDYPGKYVVCVIWKRKFAGSEIMFKTACFEDEFDAMMYTGMLREHYGLDRSIWYVIYINGKIIYPYNWYEKLN